MGMIRKTMSFFTLGLIDMRSDKERIARSSRKGAKATKAQNRLIKKQTKAIQEQTDRMN